MGSLIYCLGPFNGLRGLGLRAPPGRTARVAELGKIYYGRAINLGLPPRALSGLYLMGCFLSSGAALLASLDQLCLIIKIFDAEN